MNPKSGCVDSVLFVFWSRGQLRMAMVHLPVKFGAKFKMAAAAILDFQIM